MVSFISVDCYEHNFSRTLEFFQRIKIETNAKLFVQLNEHQIRCYQLNSLWLSMEIVFIVMCLERFFLVRFFGIPTDEPLWLMMWKAILVVAR